MDSSVLKMTVHFTDPSLDEEEQEWEVQNLFNQLRSIDEVESVNRVIDPSPPDGNKASGGFIAGALATEVQPFNLGTVFGFLSDRLARKPIELEVEVGGRKLRFKANSQEDFMKLLPSIQQLIDSPASVDSIPIAMTTATPVASSKPTAIPSFPVQPLSVFFSYSHKDEDLRDELAVHLTMLKRQGLISSWYDREISAGTDWAGAIDDHLQQAQIILLLISANFLASDYCYDIELKQAMEHHTAGKARVIPIILKPSDWNNASFGHLQALPKNAKPITTWENRDEAFLNVVQGIRAAIQHIAGAGAIQ